MKPWILPASIVGVVAVSVTLAGFAGVQPMPVQHVEAGNTRISVVCPAFTTVTANVRVSAAAVNQTVRMAGLYQPKKAKEFKNLATMVNPHQPVRVSVANSHLFGASTISGSMSGPSRGLAASICNSPQAEHWFTGVDVSKNSQAELNLVNLDETEAIVDLTAYGQMGRIAAPRGISVRPGSQTKIAMSLLNHAPAPVTVQVTTSQGRIAAFVNQATWAKGVVSSSDWVPDESGPATELVLPGVPSGGGRRTLVVNNPGSRSTSVRIDVLGKDGLSQLADAPQVTVPPGTTQSVDLAKGLDGQPAGLRLSSDYPVTASVLVDNGRPASAIDAAVGGFVAPLPSDGIWPVMLGKTSIGQIQFVNPGTTDATATVQVAGDAKAGKEVQITVPANGSIQVAMPKANLNTVRIRTASTVMRAAILVTGSVGKVQGLAILDLSTEEMRARPAQVIFDPHLG